MVAPARPPPSRLPLPHAAVNGFYLMCDTFGWFAAYKIPRTAAMAVPPELFRATMKEALVRLLLSVPSAVLLYKGMHHFGSYVNAPLPSLTSAYFQVCTTAHWS